MICWSCQKIKGKRNCPASPAAKLTTTDPVEGKICSKCCGTKRGTLIDCPSDCPYLHGEHDPRWESQEQQDEQTRFMGRFHGATQEQLPFLIFVHHVLLKGGLTQRGLDDAALVHILETTHRNLETRASGILYDHQIERVDLQPLVEWLSTFMMERSKISWAPKLDDTEAAKILEIVVKAVRQHGEANEPRRYLELAERVFAPLLAEAPPLEIPEPPKPSGGLIVPP